MRMLSLAAAAALSIGLLAGCSEKPQVIATKKSDTQPWQGAANPFVTGSWKAGDETSWDAHMRARAQGQNEYSRAPAKP